MPLFDTSAQECKGVFSLSNQLPNFSKNRGMQQGKAAFRDFHEQNIPPFLLFMFKIAIISTIFTEKYVKLLELAWTQWFEGINIKNIAYLGFGKWKMIQNMLETLTPLSSIANLSTI